MVVRAWGEDTPFELESSEEDEEEEEEEDTPLEGEVTLYPLSVS
jgi:hypothetical protein